MPKTPPARALLADLQRAKAPGPERQALQVELQKVFEKAVLELEVLRAQESPLGPDHRLQSLHWNHSTRTGAREQSPGGDILSTMASTPSEPHFVRHLLPRSGSDADFAALGAMFAQCGFTAEGICERLQIPAIGEYRNVRQGRAVVHSVEDALDALIRLLMDGEYVERATLERLLPPGALPLMESLGVTSFEPDRPELCFGALTLYPVEGLLLANDRASAPDNTPFTLAPDVIYPAAEANTLKFLDAMPRSPCDSFLDIGTGTGVAALAAARFARHAWGTDIAARSALFAEFNRRLNGIGNATMLEGDLYQPVEGLTFDCIVSHPPYVPARERPGWSSGMAARMESRSCAASWKDCRGFCAPAAGSSPRWPPPIAKGKRSKTGCDGGWDRPKPSSTWRWRPSL